MLLSQIAMSDRKTSGLKLPPTTNLATSAVIRRRLEASVCAYARPIKVCVAHSCRSARAGAVAALPA
ncbi:hypothetical protein [Lysobacter gummosus]